MPGDLRCINLQVNVPKPKPMARTKGSQRGTFTGRREIHSAPSSKVSECAKPELEDDFAMPPIIKRQVRIEEILRVTILRGPIYTQGGD